MPRKPRLFVVGAAYHVYSRTARGERPFGDAHVMRAFLDGLGILKQEHGLTILAWCVMPNHYHLVLRAGELPLLRSLRLLQGRFAKAFNRRSHLLGPFWQGRYKARVIESASYLMQAIAYVHLKPVASRLAEDPAGYRWSGHRELLGRGTVRLCDVDDALLSFAPTRRAARSAYMGALGRDRQESWMGEAPGRLPWWRRSAEEAETLSPLPGRPQLDWLGLAPPRGRPKVDAAALVARIAEALDVDATALAGRGQVVSLTRARELVMLVGIETCGLKVKELAAQVGRNPGSGSRLYTQAVARRRQEVAFRDKVARLTEAVRRDFGRATTTTAGAIE